MEISADKERTIRRNFEINHFTRMLRFELDAVDRDHAVLSVEVRKELTQLQGVMHGGAIASLIDTAVAFAIVGASERAGRFTTVEMKVNYLRAISEGRVTAEARLIRNGRRIIVAECDVHDSKGRLAAKGLLTYIRLDEPADASPIE
ncbi:MAG TPA: PaaI family thioesterase [Blastocatellia bacterium]|nr:PaaI family thioesterase [Blastocatellia bacterium]